MNEQDIWELLLGGLFLATASFWATVHLAYRYAGDAGVTRFIDKYPSARRFAFWTRRWDVLTAAPLIAWVVAAIGAITLLSPAVGDGWTPQDSLRLIALVLGFILLIRIIPVAISEGYSDRIAAILLPVVVVITAPLFPLAWLVSIAETKLTRLFVKQAPDDHRPSSEDEIISLMDHADSDDTKSLNAK